MVKRMTEQRKKGFIFGPRGGSSEAAFTVGTAVMNSLIAGLESSIKQMQEVLFECLGSLEDELKSKFIEYYRPTIYTLILHSGFDDHTTDGMLAYLEKVIKEDPDEIQTFDQLVLSYEGREYYQQQLEDYKKSEEKKTRVIKHG